MVGARPPHARLDDRLPRGGLFGPGRWDQSGGEDRSLQIGEVPANGRIGGVRPAAMEERLVGSAEAVLTVRQRLANPGSCQDRVSPVVDDLSVELVEPLVAPSLCLVETPTGLHLADQDRPAPSDAARAALGPRPRSARRSTTPIAPTRAATLPPGEGGPTPSWPRAQPASARSVLRIPAERAPRPLRRRGPRSAG